MMERKQKRSLPGLQRMRPSMRVAGFTVALSISLVASGWSDVRARRLRQRGFKERARIKMIPEPLG